MRAVDHRVISSYALFHDPSRDAQRERDRRDPGIRRRRALYDLAFDIGFAHHVELAPLVLEEDGLRRLRERERLVARDIDAEGIPL